jgi:hypothetical protein
MSEDRDEEIIEEDSGNKREEGSSLAEDVAAGRLPYRIAIRPGRDHDPEGYEGRNYI